MLKCLYVEWKGKGGGGFIFRGRGCTYIIIVIVHSVITVLTFAGKAYLVSRSLPVETTWPLGRSVMGMGRGKKCCFSSCCCCYCCCIFQCAVWAWSLCARVGAGGQGRGPSLPRSSQGAWFWNPMCGKFLSSSIPDNFWASIFPSASPTTALPSSFSLLHSSLSLSLLPFPLSPSSPLLTLPSSCSPQSPLSPPHPPLLPFPSLSLPPPLLTPLSSSSFRYPSPLFFPLLHSSLLHSHKSLGIRVLKIKRRTAELCELR